MLFSDENSRFENITDKALAFHGRGRFEGPGGRMRDFGEGFEWGHGGGFGYGHGSERGFGYAPGGGRYWPGTAYTYRDGGVPDLASVAQAIGINVEDLKKYGKRGVSKSGVKDMNDMLDWALKDEYIARNDYDKIVDNFGADVAWLFNRLRFAERRHIDILNSVYEQYNLKIPKVSTTVDKIPTMHDAYLECEDAEIKNISMYAVFMNTIKLPTDVMSAFSRLMNASFHHLAMVRDTLASES
ncbi:hypothetical protein LSH36_793g00009 [Paralvinella palmiformis]|uniref:Rubrerythrin diiron-binding domain-containing protein n=1 Tax=Paralvinella palmiformis TaxID=53620 RepID=A0AAD9MSP0_9ANNE|nr:hypothetical protein LSH36_793g00009 [Paralvinella palmiformis]